MTSPDHNVVFAVFHNLDGPKRYKPGDRMILVGVARLSDMEEDYGPLVATRSLGLPVVELERIRSWADRDTIRPMKQGDVIVLDGMHFEYDADPVIGGFSALTREQLRGWV